jgi:hypothetical protein
MSNIVWDQIEDKTYETGLDRGVLFFPDGGAVAWNGLTSVDEINRTTSEPVYFDGVKFNDIVTLGDFAAVLRAYTYPDEFLQFEGIVEEQTGLYLADQPQNLFHLSYRTMIGTADDQGYKLHLLWNLTAIPAVVSHQTVSDSFSPIEFEWSITAIPESIPGYRPTAHVILDSRRIDPLLLQDIETILYGDPLDEDRVPTMPSLKGFVSYVRKWDRLIITDNGDGTWTATANAAGVIEMLSETEFEITSDTAEFIDPPDNETYEISSSEKNEEDI